MPEPDNVEPDDFEPDDLSVFSFDSDDDDDGSIVIIDDPDQDQVYFKDFLILNLSNSFIS